MDWEKKRGAVTGMYAPAISLTLGTADCERITAAFDAGGVVQHVSAPAGASSAL
jgi:hypothetical protein